MVWTCSVCSNDLGYWWEDNIKYILYQYIADVLNDISCRRIASRGKLLGTGNKSSFCMKGRNFLTSWVTVMFSKDCAPWILSINRLISKFGCCWREQIRLGQVLTCLNLMKLNIYSYIRCKTMTVCLILFLFSLNGLLCISDWELCKMSSEISTENKFDSYMYDGSSKNYKPTELQIYITLLSAVVAIWTTHFNIEMSVLLYRVY